MREPYYIPDGNEPQLKRGPGGTVRVRDLPPAPVLPDLELEAALDEAAARSVPYVSPPAIVKGRCTGCKKRPWDCRCVDRVGVP